MNDNTKLTQTIDDGETQLANKPVDNNVDNQPGLGDFLALILALAPIALFAYCYIVSAGSFSENGPGAIWWFMVFYYWTVGIPFFMVSFILGIKRVVDKKKRNKVAVASLIVNGLKIAFVLVYFLLVYLRYHY